MAQRDPELRRRQLLEAALAEFSAYGIAGARVDRIAKKAGVSAGLVYVHFGNKEELFDAVFAEITAQAIARTPDTPDDLAEYAGKLFDGFEAHPEVLRLLTWYRLEHAEGKDPLKTAVDSNRARVDAIARMQADGKVTKRFTAAEIFGLILHIAGFWDARSPEYKAIAGRTSRAHRRKVVTDAVAAMLAD
jgi:AcrR family transcriptional regulator